MSLFVRYVPISLGGGSGGGGGTVTSVGLAAPASILTVSGSPVTTSGTLTLSLATQAANTVWAGPTTGSAANPAFRALVAADIPNLSSIYLPLAGGTMSGAINMGSQQINALNGPTLSTDAATKGYVDSAISGLTWQGPAQAYAASNVPLTGATPLVIDGYTVLNNDLIILGAQTVASQNGEYSVAILGGAYTLTANGLPTAVGDAWLIVNGTVYADSAFVATAVVPAATFIPFAGPTAYIFNAPLTLTGRTVGITQATTSTNGYLSSADWNTFNGKQSALTFGNLTDAGTDGIVVTGGTGAVIGSGTSIAQHVADTTHNGYLSSTDWNTFNNKQSTLTLGNLTDAGTDGITVTGGSGAVVGSGTSISQHVADTTHNGYLSSTDWNTFNGKGSGSVTSVAFAAPGGIFGVSGSPVTTSGTLTLTTTGTSGGVAYFSNTSTLQSSGALTQAQLVLGGGAGSAPTSLAAGSQYQVLVMGPTGFPGYSTVALNQSAAVTGTLPVGNGGIGVTTATANTVFAGPTSGGATAPAFRAIVSADLPTAAFIAPTVQKFTSSSGTYTTPTSPRSPVYLRVRMVGPGGGGGASTTNAGSAGSAATTFGTSLLSAGAGGGGGSGNGTGTGGTGGTSSLGSGPIGTALTGGSGGGSGFGNNTSAGMGASTPFGGGGGNGGGGAAGITAPANTGGGGGGGGANSSNPGGAGGGAGGFVDAIITSPSATYAYTVGSGGAGGSAGVDAGGAGAAGYIEVAEYYQ